MSQTQRPVSRRPVDLLLVRLEYQLEALRSISSQCDYIGLGGAASDMEYLWMQCARVTSKLGERGGRYPSRGILPNPWADDES